MYRVSKLKSDKVFKRKEKFAKLLLCPTFITIPCNMITFETSQYASNMRFKLSSFLPSTGMFDIRVFFLLNHTKVRKCFFFLWTVSKFKLIHHSPTIGFLASLRETAITNDQFCAHQSN